MSDEAQGEKTLEQQLEDWVYVALARNEFDPSALSRFLQLARRDGYKRGVADLVHGASDLGTVSQGARKAFPVTRPVTEPSVAPDPHGVGEWSYEQRENDAVFWWRQGPSTTWTGVLPPLTPDRVRVLNALLEEPTITRTVEE